MRRNKKAFLAGAMILVLLASLLLTVLPVSAGDFGSGAKFDSPNKEKSFNPSTTTQDREKPYFLHDQLIKLVLLLVFMGVTALIIIRSRYKYRRKIILIASVAVSGLYLGGFLCPLTAIQNLFMKWQTGYLLLFLAVLVPTLLWGRTFCGYICPFGALQELLHFKRISRKIPLVWDRYLTRVKYFLLGYLVVRVLVTGQVILQGYTPFKALFTWGGTPLSIGLTLVFAILSLIMYRPFCRYLCPLGAFLALLSRFCLFKVKVNSHCVSCGLCERVCKSRAIAGKPPIIDGSECILCGACMEKCPKKAIVKERTKIWDISETGLCPVPIVEKNPQKITD
jgi:polyferredoxin